MATCKECVHVGVCRYYTNELAKANGIPLKLEEVELLLGCDDCENFKDRSRFVELPVTISDKYYMDIKQAKTVSNMLLTISQNFEYNGDNSSAFKSYFIGVGDAIESCLKVLTPFWKEKK